MPRAAQPRRRGGIWQAVSEPCSHWPAGQPQPLNKPKKTNPSPLGQLRRPPGQGDVEEPQSSCCPRRPRHGERECRLCWAAPARGPHGQLRLRPVYSPGDCTGHAPTKRALRPDRPRESCPAVKRSQAPPAMGVSARRGGSGQRGEIPMEGPTGPCPPWGRSPRPGVAPLGTCGHI